MKYKVIKAFRDRFTKVIYRPGKEYETDDTTRAATLQNRGYLLKPVEIEKEPSDITPVEVKADEIVDEIFEEDEQTESNDTMSDWKIKHIGGGWWELPNSERVKGKEDAENALKSLIEAGDSDESGGT